MEFGLLIPQRAALFGVAPLPFFVEQAAACERTGLFGSVWVGDSLLAVPRPHSLTLLAAMAQVTERITLGVGCLASFPVRDPVTFAYEWASLDLLSGGRTLLAVCTGITTGREHEASAFGITDRERPARLEEGVDVMRKLWSGDHVSHRGTFHSFDDVSVGPKPLQQPCPVWIAANPARPPAVRERALRRVARLADGWMTIPGHFAEDWAELRGYLGEANRDPDAFPHIQMYNVNINEDEAAGLEETKRFLDAYYDTNFPAAVVAAQTASGSPFQIAARLRQEGADGCRALGLRITSWSQEAQFARLTEEVLPMVEGD